MSRLRSLAVIIACTFALIASGTALAGPHKEGPVRQAIVLAAFGTSYPQALQSIMNIKHRVEAAFPDTPVKLAFTSNIIRKKWQRRSTDAKWQAEHPDIPVEVLHVKTPLATIADLQNDGFKDITVQSLHVFAGEEFDNLKQLMLGLQSIRTLKAKSVPFKRLRLGRPALGMPGDKYPYEDDIAAAVKVLRSDVEEAKAMDAALVYMGHGNDFYSTGIYAELQRSLETTHHHPVFLGCVEGYPGFDDVLAALAQSGKQKVLLKPFMVVAGDHASNDMAGDEDDSWKVLLTAAGYDVTPQLRGLGSLDAWADLYVNHLRDAMSQTHLLR